MTDFKRAVAELAKGGSLTLASVADGYDAFCLADLIHACARAGEERSVVLVHVARDSTRARAFGEALAFAAPDVEILDLPSWDCQPYDRVSPNAAIAAKRMMVLARLARSRSSLERPRILSTTVNALVQRLPPLRFIAANTFSAAPGNAVALDGLAAWLETNGFARSSTVRDTGEYAVRGGIVDLYAPGMAQPVRLDFFGDTLESIRSFDPETQRTIGQLRALDLVPMSEVQLTTETIRHFRQAYVARFNAQTRGDTLYETISEGRRHPGCEHWLPLFYDHLDTLFDYVGGAPFVLDPQAEEAAKQRLAQIKDYYEARKSAYDADPAHVAYKPLPPDALYQTPEQWGKTLSLTSLVRISPFAVPPDSSRGPVVDLNSKPGRSFAAERADPEANVFEAALTHVRALQGAGKRVILAAWTDGSRERLAHVMADHGLKDQETISSFTQAQALKPSTVALGVIGLEQGFEAEGLAVVGEQDILGDRIVQTRRKVRRAQDFLSEVASLQAGDLVVHVEHGIGRFIGLQTIEAAGVRHDCLELHYAEGTKLFLPVENLELLSRYGSEESDVPLDRLGGGAWQKRKARMRRHILEMASGLIKVAAARETREAPKLVPPEGLYAEFCSGFPYEETEDQQATIDSVLEDLSSGKPMDRLVCGDVGFGKTEVALRAAFDTAINGKQVAVIVPTTLLARQHYKNFSARFAHLPVTVAQMSRMVSAADLKAAKAGISSGNVDIIVGTHAVLGKGITFKDLGLVIIDEEQHFGVKHKERLKELRAEVHVLTLSATPIPRTLQLAMTGVRDLSIIATPPVDRLAVRTFISPFDDLLVREALLRERYRGGQSFYVAPRIEDLEDVATYLRTHVPEVKFVVAHGQMAATELEDKMAAFYEGKYDVLLSTAIVESGLDIPTANTLIVHRADMFGLAALYQLRGRVGRSKIRAYALFTVPPNKTLTPQAERRLKVLSSLDTLGAGFQLASHDLDIRGAGNLLGDAQSGHIKEVGYELYQQMLQEAVEALKSGIEAPVEEAWSPTITLGTPVTIPEDYVPDLQLRLTLYRRLSTIESEAEIESFAAEMIDRFGPMPKEVEQLMQLVAIKLLCRKAHVEKVDAGPKGVIIGFRDNAFANPQGLVRYVAQQGSEAKVRADMKIVFSRDFANPNVRLEGTKQLVRTLAAIAMKQAA
ncbi:transcription-repair coupling factor [Beijerinckia indica]|uniref:Transcription-repair-coupling factor n=1 Tax=Beijerinckia indica subsp. indica (strain ATCC 9039 / DSM 1715 / NCIMB 8712) TaxID=395963 RepID=B2IHM2_BEII9|nr:transcription-repair coupling factor [Beijerinckia indica]ACB94543.1 transcription-repair coupling factor [Beijerinckia indica subsp. indica ATCC 9039]